KSRHPELFQVRQMSDDGFESSFGRECAHMQFIKDVIAQRCAKPTLILPCKRGIKHLGCAVDIESLKFGCRIRAFRTSVQTVKVSRAWFDPFHDSLMISTLNPLQTLSAFLRKNDVNI